MEFGYLAVACAGLLIAAPAAAAGLVKAQDPQGIAQALQAAGYQAKLTTDKTGDPMIESAADGSNFQIFFYNCTKNRDCATIQFHAGYSVKSKPTLERMNEWNRNQRFGRGYIDGDGDPIIQMDLDLDDGGLSPDLFIDNLEFWTAVKNKFEVFFGFHD